VVVCPREYSRPRVFPRGSPQARVYTPVGAQKESAVVKPAGEHPSQTHAQIKPRKRAQKGRAPPRPDQRKMPDSPPLYVTPGGFKKDQRGFSKSQGAKY